MSKKLINNADNVVDEALAGLVAACPGLTILQGHRVTVRADVEGVVRDGKVSRSTVFRIPYLQFIPKIPLFGALLYIQDILDQKYFNCKSEMT